MKVRLTFEFSDDERRALASHYGEAGKASHATCATWVRTQVLTVMQDIVAEHTVPAPKEVR